MNEGRTYASLSSGLLARKGAAKPAMRPQAYGSLEDLGWNDMGHGASPEPDEPVAIPEHVPSPITALTPAPRPGEIDPETFYGEEEEEEGAGFEPAAAHFPAQPAPIEPEPIRPEPVAEVEEDHPVVAQQRAILERFDGEQEADEAPAPEPDAAPAAKARQPRAEVVPMPKRAAAAAKGRKSAFTLRLDASRHLRLRLACAVTGRSAQQIVTDALDAALSGIPEIEALAERVPVKAGSAGAKRN
jgi:hypothetical protein